VSGTDVVSYRPAASVPRILSMENGGPYVVLPTQLFDGLPHHLVLSYTSPTWTAYLDGVAVGTFTDGGRRTAADGTVYIGVSGGTRACAYENVAVYHHQLSADRVAAHWAARGTQQGYVSAVLADMPSAFWQLNDPVGSPSFLDSAGSLNLPAGGVMGTQSFFATS